MDKIGFRTIDYFDCPKSFKLYLASGCLYKAQKCGLVVLEFDLNHMCMRGYKRQFLKYYLETMAISKKAGGSLLEEFKRIIQVIFWK